jgi:hypothetical protein
MAQQTTLFDELDTKLHHTQLSAQAREQARQILLAKHAENPEALAWLGLMAELRQQHGLTVDEAAYVAWLCVPSDQREPRTKAELAAMLGHSPSWTSSVLNKRPFLLDLVTAVSKQQVIGRVPEILDAAVEVAINEGYKGHNDRKMLLTMAGLTTEAQDISLTAVATTEQAAQLSDAELERRLMRTSGEDDTHPDEE